MPSPASRSQSSYGKAAVLLMAVAEAVAMTVLEEAAAVQAPERRRPG